MNGRSAQSAAFIFNLKDINASLDDIAAECMFSNPKKELMQSYLEATNPD